MTSIQEFSRRRSLRIAAGAVGTTVLGLAVGNLIFDLGSGTGSFGRRSTERPVPTAPVPQPPDPRTAQTPEERIARMERLNVYIKEFLAPFREEMAARGVKVYDPVMFAQKSGVVGNDVEILEAFAFPSKDAKPLRQYALKAGTNIAWDGHVGVTYANGTDGFFAITYNPLSMEFIFRTLYENTGTEIRRYVREIQGT